MSHDTLRHGQEPEVLDAIERLASIGATIETSGGQMPVQIEGFYQGEPFYFRARGRKWRLWIGEGAQVLRQGTLFEERVYCPEGTAEEDKKYIAGAMDEATALGLLQESLERRANIRA